MKIRKFFTAIEEIVTEGEKPLNKPIFNIGVALVMENPWKDQGFVEDLSLVVAEYSPQLGKMLVDKLFTIIDSPDQVEAYGKAVISGSEVEIEHSSALIHTLKFGRSFRDAVQGESLLASTNKRGAPGMSITIPMVHKNDDWIGSHFNTFEFNMPDAPRAHEIVVAIGVCSSGRPHARTKA